MILAVNSLDENSQKHKNIIEIMESGLETQSDAKLGIFWYDRESGELFGVRSAFADEISYDGNGSKTIRTLHKSVWAKEKQRAASKSQNTLFKGDYTLIPRGRIFQFLPDNHFEIMVGSWIDKYPAAVELIINEFDLPPDTVVTKDIHWEIGHGWSE
ncbi:MAG: hypothetical protein FWF82_01355 [Oscillospiraceae bacterium]|nr:hypothetical protein [Oscillospiraceae bacterium]